MRTKILTEPEIFQIQEDPSFNLRGFDPNKEKLDPNKETATTNI